MRLSCPNCLTEYDIPDTALAGRRRSLRCARCGHQWLSPDTAVAPEVALPVAAIPMPEVLEQPVAMPAAPVVPIAAPFAEVVPEVVKTPAAARTFGVAVDEDALAEVESAAKSENAAPLGVVAAETNTATGVDLPSVALPDYTLKESAPGEGPDGFAELFRATRDKGVTYEPEPPAKQMQMPKLPVGNKQLLIGLVVLFVIALVVLERHAVMHVLPFTKGIFHGLGLG